MPTARELLEQADALMRRDRDALGTGERARPSSTPIATTPRPLAAAVSPRTIQREPIAPSVARTSLPVHPTDSPALAASGATSAIAASSASAVPEARLQDAAPQVAAAVVPEFRAEATIAAGSRGIAPAIDADFPTLTDVVVDVVEAEEHADDVPLLTEAVAAIDLVEPGGIEEGEPSIWDVSADGERSVLGRAPDSVSAVPPLDRMPVAPPSERDPLGLDQPAPGFVAPPSALAPPGRPAEVVPAEPPAEDAAVAEAGGQGAAEAAFPEPGLPPAGAPWTDAPAGWAREAPAVSPPEGEGSRPVDEATPTAAESHGAATLVPPLRGAALAGFAPLRPQPGYDAGATLDWDEAEDAAAENIAVAEPVNRAPGATGEASEATAPSAVAAAPPLDEARIAEAVDEIRMQVLQRIDIFTDTTLRAKLGEQLTPLVERASADLVAAINQHVGDLLRTHVAEALEQEIERWRAGQR
jgi:hypothetical protein